MIFDLILVGVWGTCAGAGTVGLKSYLKHRRNRHQHLWEIVKVEPWWHPNPYKKGYENRLGDTTHVYYRCNFHIPPETKMKEIEGAWTIEELKGELAREDA
jgi:hypothetical protein